MGVKIRFGANINGKSFQNLIFKIQCTACLNPVGFNVACLCYQSMKVYESKERAQCVS